MMKTRWMMLFTIAAALAWVSPAIADKDKDKGHGKGHHAEQRDNDRDDDRWERREGYEYRTYGRGDVPPGWNKGKKTGWGNCGMPPGQAKKYGCRAYTYQGRTHYYYQDEQGRVFVRRPAVQDRDHDGDRDNDRR